MLKKDSLGTASAKSLSEAFRCNECLHYKHHAHSSRDKVCIEEGVKGVGIAPRCFTPDVTQVAKNSDQFVQIASLFQNFTTKERKIFLGLLRDQRKRQFEMGTKLYFKVGRDFVSNYLAAFVMGYTSGGQLILMGSPDKRTRGSSFVSYINQNSEGLMTAQQWRVKRTELQLANKIHDPNNKVIVRNSIIDAYEPPTIDTFPQMFDTKDKSKTSSKSRSRRSRVADVVDQLSFNITR